MNSPLRTRQRALERFGSEEFDVLIIGGGITGAATARDAASRGLKVALVEKRDFAWGTSSRSSKLIHGGLRYLEHREFSLVFEALKERKHLLDTSPHLVKPLTFYMPIYRSDPHGRLVLGLGMWLYDLLSLFRAPGFHRYLSKKKLMEKIPALRSENLKGGFLYYDASMSDDLLALETLRAAQGEGAVVANYVEAVEPLYRENRVVGFKLKDSLGDYRYDILAYAKKTIICAGPWTDVLGKKLSYDWKPWLVPSKGAHLIFDLSRLPAPGAIVMSHPSDGRIAFVIPRPDLGNGVSIVGTTDAPSPENPEKTCVDKNDVTYLMDLLHSYFPSLHLTPEDIMSAYVGVRPLMDPGLRGEENTGAYLQKVSREHHIGFGPGGVLIVCGGKYTTHRSMAKEIVDALLFQWREDFKKTQKNPPPDRIHESRTDSPVNRQATREALEESKRRAIKEKWGLPSSIIEQIGLEAHEFLDIKKKCHILNGSGNPEGFPELEGWLRFWIQRGMVMHLEDFYLRRMPLYLARRDHGLPWAEALSKVWAEEMGLDAKAAQTEYELLKKEIETRSLWRKNV